MDIKDELPQEVKIEQHNAEYEVYLETDYNAELKTDTENEFLLTDKYLNSANFNENIKMDITDMELVIQDVKEETDNTEYDEFLCKIEDRAEELEFK